MPICPICEQKFDFRSKHPQEKYCSNKHKKAAQNKRNYRKRCQSIKRERGASFIYFAIASNMVKIGISTDPGKRIKALQTGNPIEIKLLGTISGSAKDERKLQNSLSSYRTTGEWFAYVGEVKTTINHLLEKTHGQ